MNSPSLSSILFVDDDEISNLINKIFIGKLNLNVKVDFVLNGKEALDELAPAKDIPTIITPCLLLLDIKMPIMDGWEFIAAYEEQVSPEIRNQVVIVMLTTSRDERDMVKAMNNSNIKEIIEKPLSEMAMTRLIDKYFSNNKMVK